MLIELHIRNFALIDELRVELGSGFSALTGETGAGKSIVVDAINAALGERVGSEVVRTGADKAVVEAVFDVSDSPNAASIAESLGYEGDDGVIILSREIAREGRSQCRINGRPATASVVKDISSHLVDIHGQHEHQSLLAPQLHAGIFDAWCGEKVTALKERAAAAYSELSKLESELSRLRSDQRERARLLDLYGFQVDEIQAANLEPGEEEILEQERNRLANAEKLYAAASEVYQALGDDGGGVDALSNASLSAIRIAHLDPSMEPLIETINNALIAAQEAQSSIRDYMEEVEANPARLENIEDRLNLLRTLKKKYGDSIEEILVYFDETKSKLENLANTEERSGELESNIAAAAKSLKTVCSELTAARREAAPEFAKLVERELADLAMDKTRFQVGIEPAQPGPTGADAVEFLISPNPGEPLKPLAKIASGGELSRIMLALKSVTTAASMPTLVFDEIDTGIGGLTAQVLGEKLGSLATRYQVMCVTHLPQIASRATAHFAVEKYVEGGRSLVRLIPLDGENRVTELARMLGSEESSSAALSHAREMLAVANRGNCQTR